MSGQILCKPVVIPITRAFTHRACRLSDRKNQSCDPIDDRFEFDRLHMTIGLQTGMDTVFAYRFANRSRC